MQTPSSLLPTTFVGRILISLASMVMIQLVGYTRPNNTLICITLLMSPKSHLHHFIWNVKPLQWFCWYIKDHEEPQWTDFCQLLLHRFGPSGFDEFTRALTKLRQTDTVREYQIEFENLVKHTEGFSDAFYRSCFISGIKDTI